MFKFLNLLSDRINKYVEIVAVIAFAIITTLTFTGIVFRYALGSPIIWLYETTLILFSWVTFLGISIAFKKKEHIHLDFIFAHLSNKVLQWLNKFIILIILLLLAIMLWDSIQIISETYDQDYNTIPVSVSMFYVPFFACAVISILHIICQFPVTHFKEK